MTINGRVFQLLVDQNRKQRELASVEWILTGEEHLHTSFVNNGSVAGNLGQHYGTLIVRNGGERVLSDECAELVRIYESLGIKQRISLLNAAFELEAGGSPPKQN